GMRRGGRKFGGGSIGGSCWTMPRPSSPTAASSASAPRSASPPAASTPAAQSASSTHPPSRPVSTAGGRSDRETPPVAPAVAPRSRVHADPRLAGRAMPIPRVRLPTHTPGMRIGLFGGTFDPAHGAHLGASLLAMKRLDLDRVWWLVTPGNPLKNTRGLAPLDERIVAARRLARHPRIAVSGLEAEIGTHYTFETIAYLRRHCPGVRFVWIMGADNLRSFHRWQRWRGIAAAVPIAVVDRLGPSLYASASAAGQALARARLSEAEAKSLADRKPPVWVYLHGLKSPLSSTAWRAP